MAGIDKTYLNKEQATHFFKWFNKNKNSINEFLGYEVGLYNSEEDFMNLSDDEDDFLTLWNTPEEFDIWLLNNCPVMCIQNRLAEQYGEDWANEHSTK